MNRTEMLLYQPVLSLSPPREQHEPWFVAKDAAEVLGYRDAPTMTRNIDEEDAATHNVGSRSSNGVLQSRELTIINESGLYTAILHSRRP